MKKTIVCMIALGLSLGVLRAQNEGAQTEPAPELQTDNPTLNDTNSTETNQIEEPSGAEPRGGAFDSTNLPPGRPFSTNPPPGRPFQEDNSPPGRPFEDPSGAQPETPSEQPETETPDPSDQTNQPDTEQSEPQAEPPQAQPE